MLPSAQRSLSHDKLGVLPSAERSLSNDKLADAPSLYKGDTFGVCPMVLMMIIMIKAPGDVHDVHC